VILITKEGPLVVELKTRTMRQSLSKQWRIILGAVEMMKNASTLNCEFCESLILVRQG